MDMVIFLLISVYIVYTHMGKPSSEGIKTKIEKEDTTRVAKLNPDFYEDDDAFMDIAHELGF